MRSTAGSRSTAHRAQQAGKATALVAAGAQREPRTCTEDYTAMVVTCHNLHHGVQKPPLWTAETLTHMELQRKDAAQPRFLAVGLVWCLSLGPRWWRAVLWLWWGAASEGAAGVGEQPGRGIGDWWVLYRAKDRPSPMLQRRDNLRLPYRSSGLRLPQEKRLETCCFQQHRNASFLPAVLLLQSRYSTLEKVHGKREIVGKWKARKTRPHVRKVRLGHNIEWDWRY